MAEKEEPKPTNHDLLIRIDERLKAMEENYVTKDEFEPVKRVVYGMVGLLLSGMVLAIIALVIV